MGNGRARRGGAAARVAALVLALAVVAATGCTGTDGSTADATSTTAASGEGVGSTRTSAELVDRACDLADDSLDAECYWLEVPERRDVDGARTIRLWVTVVGGAGSAADQMPFLDLTGGPGDTASTPWVADEVQVAGGPGHPPIVVIDQRGTGRSEPRLACPELDPIIPPGQPWATRVATRRKGVQACRDRLVRDGVDLDGYDTVESAADLVALRQNLGYDRWVVRGFSYGGRLAQELYRQDPDGMAGLILDSTLTTDPWTLHQLIENGRADIDEIDAACTAAPSCAANGSFAANVERAAAALDADPYPVPGTDVVVDGGLFRSGLFQAMYDRELIPLLPVFAASIANGQPSIIDSVAADLLPDPESDVDTPATGTFQVVSCADEGGGVTDGDRDLLDDPGEWEDVVLGSYSFCDVWKVGAARDGGLLPARGDVPVLAMVGAFDPVHPRSFTEATTTGLANTTVVEIPAGAHGNSFADPCATSITLAFRAEPGAELDTSCVDGQASPFAGG